MENPTVSELRSRSRSKTPFLRSSCDRENCTEGDDHTHHKSGRKTPVRKGTPVKQLQQATNKVLSDPIIELDDEESPPAPRTRKSTRAEKQVKTSDYSSEDNSDRGGHRKEIFQNEVNSRYERVATSSHQYSTLGDLTFSPIQRSIHNVTQDRSTRFGSPAYSACSTDSSFAEQALADTSVLLDRDPSSEHLPYRLYKMAGEYWNKYPKTDYTYSPLSKDRVELAPGLVAVPNMSRRSLSQFRIQGPNTSADEVDKLAATWTTNYARKRYTAVDSSDDESAYTRGNGGYLHGDQRWLITRLLIAIVTTITSTTSNAYRKIVGPSHRYPYTERRPVKAGIASRTASAVAAPFYWFYSIIKTVITTTVTTVTETVTSNHVGESEKYVAQSSRVHTAAKRRWWPWFLLLLLPALGYGSHYTYENWDHLAMPNFKDFQLDLSEFTNIELPKISLPNLNILPNITLPDINITLPDIRDNLPELPEVTKTYKEYKDIVQNRMADASDYAKVVAESCFEEVGRFWRGVFGHTHHNIIQNRGRIEDLTSPIKSGRIADATLLGYNYSDVIVPRETPVIIDTYKSPQIVQDPDLSKRMAALEGWALNVDTKLKSFDIKLSKFDNLEAQIEQYSLKHLQQNLIQIFNLNENSDAIAAKLKGYFDNQYVTKEQMQMMSQEIHEKLINSWKPELDQDKIREMIQEYLAVYETRQMEVIKERLKEYVREVEVHHHHGVEAGFDVEAVKKIIAGMLQVYDADKTGLVDYALESAGGQVISTKCTELYQIKTKQYSILGLPVWWVFTSPRYALSPGAMPAECWAFQGFPGYLVIRTYAIVEVTGFSLEHMSRLLAVDGKIESAPKNFSVYGLHGEMDPEPHLFGDYMYDANGTSIQYFPVKYPKVTNIGGVDYPVAYDIIELRVESNHGNPTYTCVYRFRVHGNPLSDIRKATEDSMKDSET